MKMKEAVVDIVDYILILIFSFGQLGILLFVANSLYEFVEIDYEIREAMAYSLLLLVMNFCFLFFTKIALLLNEKKDQR